MSQVIDFETVVPFDVDGTLIIWKPEGTEESNNSIIVDYYGQPVSVLPHMEHLRLLKATLARGRFVILWSGNGVQWASNVLKALENFGYIEDTANIIVMSKPVAYVDDVPVENWLGSRIYIKPENNVYHQE